MEPTSVNVAILMLTYHVPLEADEVWRPDVARTRGTSAT